jgi:CheY-like chemotaxis protein
MNTEQSHILGLQPRVLIVDNDNSTRESQSELLLYWGYKPIVAVGSGDALIKDALTQAGENRCQIALVDMRMADDTDLDDKSGLDLIRKLAPAECIVVTGYGNDQIAAEILEESGAIAYVGKQYGPDALKQKLNRSAQKVCASKTEITIDSIKFLEEIVEEHFKSIPMDFRDQFVDIFARLFPNTKSIRLEKLSLGHISSNVSSVPRPRSILLKVTPDDKQPCIVKLARARKAKIEIENYEKFIDERLVGRYCAEIKDSCILWDIGGVKFSYIGSHARPFSDFYKSEPMERIKPCLERFFKETWSSNFEKATTERNISLFEKYCEVWERDWYETRVKKLKFLNLAEAVPPSIREKIQIVNPIEWLISRVAENGDQDASRVEETKIAITHGDLHGDNLLVDDIGNAWAIDFERSGYGHILQDFVELEADIINRLEAHNQNISSFYKLCLTVVSQSSLQEFELHEMECKDPDVQKALQAISVLRSLAGQCTGIVDAKQYLFGLLFNTIFRATIIKDETHRQSQLRALMLASIICHRLDHWDEPWPPLEWGTFLEKEKYNGR